MELPNDLQADDHVQKDAIEIYTNEGLTITYLELLQLTTTPDISFF